jgi:hypothetical protein
MRDNFDVHKWNNQRKLAEANISEMKVRNPTELVRSNVDDDYTIIYATTEKGNELLQKVIPLPAPSIESIFYEKIIPKDPNYPKIVEEAKKAYDILLPLEKEFGVSVSLSLLKRDYITNDMVVVVIMVEGEYDDDDISRIYSAIGTSVSTVLEDILNGNEIGDYEEYEEN